MRVLLIDQYGELGGAQLGMIDAAEGIVARGGQVAGALPPGPAFDRLASIAREMTPLACGPFHPRRKSAADALRFAAQTPKQVAAISRLARRADIVYVHGPRVAPAAALAVRSRPWIYHAHSILEQRAAAAVLARALRGCDGLIANSAFVGRWLEGLGVAMPARVVYGGVPAVPGGRGSVTRIGILGRVAPEKGQLEFVRAARLASAEAPRLRFIVAGSPMFAAREYYEQVRAEAASEVEFPGWITPEALFKQIGLLVTPSSPVEAAPRVVIEAFAAGVPVLASKVGGVPELIEHGKTGLLVDSVEPASLARAMVEAVRNPPLLSSIAERAKMRWRERFTLDRFQSEVCSVLEDVLRSRAAPDRAAANARV
jgi:glycosyltransferase involved in cell wall biosynthesis